MKNHSLIALSAGAVICIQACGNHNKAAEKPNIIFILIDDMGWTDTGFMGSGYYETPNIDRLARQGMIFTRAYTNAANSAPTRASLLTGQYTPRHGVYTVANSDRGEPKERRLIPVENNTEISTDKITINEALKEAGYISVSIGKWHVGKKPSDHGFDIGFDRDQLGYSRGHFNDRGEYLADRLTDESIQFITENNPARTGRPFLLFLFHHAVHTPIAAKQEDIEFFKKKTGSVCHNNPVYAAMIKSVDESVSRISDAVESLGLSRNTLLIFTSDNGGHGTYTCQKPLRGGKGMFYEGGIRVPMFAVWKGAIKPGTVCDIPVITTDFYPTFLEIAGQQPPHGYQTDGVSILPLLKGKNKLERKNLFWHFPAYLEAYEGLREDSRDPLFRSRPVSVIRKGDWKLLMYHEEWTLDGGMEKIDTNNSVELYNLINDPGEKNNLSKTAIKIRDELLGELLEWIKATGAPVASKPSGY